MDPISTAKPDPENPRLPVADIPTIILSDLSSNDQAAADKVLDACKNYGFFYLHLNDHVGRSLMHSWIDLTEYMDLYFRQPLEWKLKDEYGDDTGGYKPAGIFSGVDSSHKDDMENIKIHRGTLYDRPHSLPCSAQSTMRRKVLNSHMSSCDEISEKILSVLSKKLSLPVSLESQHRPSEPSTSFLGLQNYPAKNPDSQDQGQGYTKHTDVGTLTILLASDPGLQVHTETGWHSILPRPGHAIVNVGDSLRAMTNGALRSVVHRVDPIRQDRDRYSVCYFLRPEDSATLKDASGKEITAREFHDAGIKEWYVAKTPAAVEKAKAAAKAPLPVDAEEKTRKGEKLEKAWGEGGACVA